MFDVGFQELTLIGVIALIVVGPERLPRMARTLGLWMGKIRYYVGQVKSDIEREVRAQELKEMLDKPAEELNDLYKGALGEAKAALDGPPASISTPNEPAAGSIFPTELPDVGPAPSAAAQAESPGTSSTPPTAPASVTTGSQETASPKAEGVESGPPDESSVATDTRESDERSSERV